MGCNIKDSTYKWYLWDLVTLLKERAGQQCNDEYKLAVATVSQETLDLILESCKQFGIDPASIQLSE